MTFTSTTDFLFVILALSTTVVTIFLAATLYHVIRVLRDVEVITTNVKDTSERLNKIIVQPTKLIAGVVSKALWVSGFLGRKKKKRSADDQEDE